MTDFAETRFESSGPAPQASSKKRSLRRRLLVGLLAVVLVIGGVAVGAERLATGKMDALKKMDLSMEDVRKEAERAGDPMGISDAEAAADGEAAEDADAEDAGESRDSDSDKDANGGDSKDRAKAGASKKASSSSSKSGESDPLDSVVDETVNDGRAVNFLILGSDSRTSNGDPTNWEQNAQRSDAIMVMQVSPDRANVTVMSIPRDSFVTIPGIEGKHKINAAFEQGGVPLAIRTVQSLTGIRLDHVLVTDFQAFAAMTDAIGGVTMTSATEGTRKYSGAQALKFVRNRKELEKGDFDRMRRQQLWIKSVLEQTLTREVLGSPSKLKGVYDLMLPYMAVDNDLSLGEVLGLGKGIAQAKGGSMVFVTTPYIGTAREYESLYGGEASVVKLDLNAGTRLWAAFRAGRAAEYVQSAGGLETLSSRPIA